MRFYVYCISERVPELEKPFVGIADSEIRFVTVEELVIVVSELGVDVVPVTRENVLRHEAVVRMVFSEATPLPFRFGTLVTEPGLHSFVKSRKADLTERLNQVRNCAEMSVKIIWPNRPETDRNGMSEDFSTDATPGTAFLLSKRNELLGDEQFETEARQLGQWLTTRLAATVKQEQVTIEPRQQLVVSASFLVGRDQIAEYRRMLARLQAEKPELHFLTSGPWPPYTFANIDLEFGTHFGVS